MEYYVNENDQLISIHYAHMLDLRLSVCAIDFFSDYSRDEVEKAAAIILDEITRKVKLITNAESALIKDSIALYVSLKCSIKRMMIT